MATMTAGLGNKTSATERRGNSRTRVDGHLQLVNLGPENGGLMLDLSEGGLALQAVFPVMPELEIPVNFLLPNTDIRIDAKAQIAWGRNSKHVGLQFIDIQEATR